MSVPVCDVLVVGGGINGVGIARDAAGRGLRVVLCEKDDLAAHTSSASTKLIHGGLRYLEYYEFGLVRKALIEREVLLRCAPHLIHPLRFIMPHSPGQRPAWMIRAGLFLYDHLARRELLPGSEVVDLNHHVAGSALQTQFQRGFAYSDAAVNDARLVIANAQDAAERGASILTRTACSAARREADGWHVTLRRSDGLVQPWRARCLVNACGPWASAFLQQTLPQTARTALRLSKGSHIVVRRLFDHDYAYIFQHGDGRIVFAIPYERDFTLIGTTDLDFDGDPDQVAISPAELAYLCQLSNHYFSRQITAADVVWSYSGVRPLLEEDGAGVNAASVTRDYRLDFDNGGAPLLSVFGGKITTYRKLSEEAADKIQTALGQTRSPWTAHACLPGGDLSGAHPDNRSVREFASYLQTMQQHYPWLPAALCERYVRAYGTRVHRLLAACQNMADLGEQLAPGLFACELDYLIQHEWARSAEDVLWRRTRLGLHLPAGTAAQLEQWLQRRLQSCPPA